MSTATTFNSTSFARSLRLDLRRQTGHHGDMVRLLLDERIQGDGRRLCTWATSNAERMYLTDDDGTSGSLSRASLDRVMVRYGRALDPEVPLEGDALDVGEGYGLRRLRHHARVDVEGRDYLVWERPNAPPLAVIATHAVAALRYLVLRIEAERSAST